MKVSIITPSVRPEAIEIVYRSLTNQTFTNFEWIVGGPASIRNKLSELPDSHFLTIFAEDTFKGGVWTLNRIYNLLFTLATSELVVSLQDSIYIPPDGLQKFVDSYEIVGPDVIISGVGDQYEALDEHRKPAVKVWSDPRKTKNHGTFYEINPSDIEWNWCAVPKSAITEIGGFDEALDFLGFGMDGYQVNERLSACGYKCFIDQENESFTLRHDRSRHGGQENWDTYNNLSNGNYEKRRKELVKKGQWPIIVDFTTQVLLQDNKEVSK